MEGPFWTNIFMGILAFLILTAGLRGIESIRKDERRD